MVTSCEYLVSYFVRVKAGVITTTASPKARKKTKQPIPKQNKTKKRSFTDSPRGVAAVSWTMNSYINISQNKGLLPRNTKPNCQMEIFCGGALRPKATTPLSKATALTRYCYASHFDERQTRSISHAR